MPTFSCVFIWLFTAWMLCQLRAPGRLWASVFAFQLVSPLFFCMQSSLIVVASIRLALSGSKPMEWVATKRDAEYAEYVPPELAEQAGAGGGRASAAQGGAKPA